MPLEELLAIYRYEASAGSSIDSSSGDLTDELPDMTLDKVNILYAGQYYYIQCKKLSFKYSFAHT